MPDTNFLDHDMVLTSSFRRKGRHTTSQYLDLLFLSLRRLAIGKEERMIGSGGRLTLH